MLYKRILVCSLWVGSILLHLSNVAAQQPPTPCEEVRGTLATNMAEFATQVRTLVRENEALKAKLTEMEKKLGNGKDAAPTPSK